MNTNLNVWVLGALVALGFVANAKVVEIPRRPRPTVEQLINDKIHQLKSPDFIVRRDAARALAAMHQHARKVVPALLEAIHDEHPAVREAAESALRQLAGTAWEPVPGLTCFAARSAVEAGR